MYQESQRRKREATAIKKISSSAPRRCRRFSTRKTHVDRTNMICSADGCTNIVKKGGVCIGHGHGHGDKHKRCVSKGCTNQVIRGGVCNRHGKKRKPCKFEGCTRGVVSGGMCIEHGAKVKLCTIVLRKEVYV